jgi:ArsR family transcriptional regulator
MAARATTSKMAPLAAESRELVPVLNLLANRSRLLVLCRLAAGGEMPVTALARAVRLSPSAPSQHLSRLRHERLVIYRRQGQTLFYALADDETARLLHALKEIYCPEPAAQSTL